MRIRINVTDRPARGISPTASKNLRDFKRGFFNRDAVMKALDEEQRNRLAKSGAYVQTTAQRSMRKRKKKSPPGSPPSAHDEGKGPLLRKLLFFAFDTERKTVVVGPAALGRSETPKLHERGGTRVGRRRKPRQVGDTGPVRIIGGGRSGFGRAAKGSKAAPQRQAIYAKLTTAQQAAHATRLDTELFGNGDQKYPPRPFMVPALAASRARINELFGKPL